MFIHKHTHVCACVCVCLDLLEYTNLNEIEGRWEAKVVNGTLTTHWAVQPSFRVITCTKRPDSCREYRTNRHVSEYAKFPPPFLHGNFKPVVDCTATSSKGLAAGSQSQLVPMEMCGEVVQVPATVEACFDRACTEYGECF
jgi:hypothetical protein